MDIESDENTEYNKQYEELYNRMSEENTSTNSILDNQLTQTFEGKHQLIQARTQENYHLCDYILVSILPILIFLFVINIVKNFYLRVPEAQEKNVI
ncbi:29899_t:CDS:2 [Gigaspora margarita]|uniref:29899_t:CDS:1 n=1 Tax=Gigaspora margarita TaxID=4874 RepID=A0ABN7WM10_GIGMA|nr:29899_t:CDS:2 [Gigaspora margarita]